MFRGGAGLGQVVLISVCRLALLVLFAYDARKYSEAWLVVSYLAGTYFGGVMMVDRDLSAAVFGALHKRFFGQGGEPIEYHLRAKNNGQDDPFDEYVRESLSGDLGPDIRTVSRGPVTSPDMVIWRPSVMGAFTGDGASSDLVRIFGMEVKKLERGLKGRVARGSGMDYNSTPPCGTIRAYDDGLDSRHPQQLL